MDDKIINELRILIGRIVDDKLKEYTKDIEKVYDGEMVTDENGVLCVSVKNGLYNIPNHSGNTLNKGDAVRIYARGSNLNDAYIGVKFASSDN